MAAFRTGEGALDVAGLSPLDFIESWDPYRKRHTRKVSGGGDLFGSDPSWVTVNHYLSKATIANAVDGRETVGYYSATTSPVLSLDIDDHQSGNAWRKGGPGPRLLAAYEATTRAIGELPSILYGSPRGLHAHWFLTAPVALGVMHEMIGRKLAKVPPALRPELKPTSKTSLRIPDRSKELDPVTLTPRLSALKDCAVYAPFVLFGDKETIRAELVPARTSLKERRARLKKVSRFSLIEEAERRHRLTCRNGSSNAARLELVNLYRTAGYTQTEATQALLNFFTSCGYSGQLSKPDALVRWVAFEYRKNSDYFHAKPERDTYTPSLFESVTLEYLVSVHPWARQRTRGVRRVVEGILRWKAYQDEIWKQPEQVATWDYLYRFYRYNRKRGFYPLPFAMLRRWNFRYYELTAWLCEVGLLEAAPFGYSADLNVCRYFRICPDRFEGKQPEESPVMAQVKALRAAGRTTSEIADLFGVTRMAVNHWLNGKRLFGDRSAHHIEQSPVSRTV